MPKLKVVYTIIQEIEIDDKKEETVEAAINNLEDELMDQGWGVTLDNEEVLE